jgi:hypothetical protein
MIDINKKNRKGFYGIWEIIEFPFYILFFWQILSTILMMYNFNISSLYFSLLNWAVMLGAFGYIGYLTVNNKEKISFAVKNGAILGACIGLIGAIMSIIAFYHYPQMFSEALNQMTEQGLDIEQAKAYMKIGIYFGLLSAPIISAIIGSGVSALGAFIFKKN